MVRLHPPNEYVSVLCAFPCCSTFLLLVQFSYERADINDKLVNASFGLTTGMTHILRLGILDNNILIIHYSKQKILIIPCVNLHGALKFCRLELLILKLLSFLVIGVCGWRCRWRDDWVWLVSPLPPTWACSTIENIGPLMSFEWVISHLFYDQNDSRNILALPLFW